MCVSVLRRFCYVVFFFFSSRRRHTRCLSDWSSDVCSSDLVSASAEAAEPGPQEAPPAQPLAPVSASAEAEAAEVADAPSERSEERRVGKECRSRWAREQ